jgi:hypothetical protein
VSHDSNESTEPEKASGSASRGGNDNVRQEPATPEQAAKPSVFSLLLRHWRLVGVLLLVLAVITTYLWKNIAVSRAKAQVSRQAAVVIASHNESYLRLVALPLVWTVRSEMLRGNYDQINQYLAQFVREPNMKEVLVARSDGRIVAATDKKREGAVVSDLFPPEVRQMETITVTNRPDGTILVAAPVMGLNEKLGVLLLVAAPPPYTLEGADTAHSGK